MCIRDRLRELRTRTLRGVGGWTPAASRQDRFGQLYWQIQEAHYWKDVPPRLNNRLNERWSNNTVQGTVQMGSRNIDFDNMTSSTADGRVRQMRFIALEVTRGGNVA